MLFFLSLFACQDRSQETPHVETVKSEKVKKEETSESKPAAVTPKCTYLVKEAKPEWTAYKYTEKAAVGGTFNTFTLSTPQKSDSFTKAVEGLSIEIDAASVESNNPGRNATIAGTFFGLFAPQNSIKGNVILARGDEKKGEIQINIDMNGVQKPYTFGYENKEGKIVASSVMDMMDFNLTAPYDSIHTACKTLHTGTDGVAKTWTEVALRVVVSYDKACK